MFEFFRRKNDEESKPEGEAKALPEGESEQRSSSDDRVLREAVEAMLTSRDEDDASVDVDVDEEETAVKAKPQAKRAAGSANVIGSDTKISGDLSSKKAVLVLGEIEGNVDAVEVTVEKGGVVRGDVAAKEDVVIRGTVHGNMRVQGKLTITASGSVTGGVKARAIAIEEGGELRGRCTMATDASKLSVVSAS